MKTKEQNKQQSKQKNDCECLGQKNPGKATF